MKKKLLYALSIFLIVYNLQAQDVWTTQTSGVSTDLNEVVYANSTYVAVGTSGVILTSTNGTTWTPRTSGVTTTLQSVAYGNGTFVVVGNSTVIITSPDGITWSTTKPNPFVAGSTSLQGVEYVNGVFIAVGQAGAIATSTDGNTWTVRHQASSLTSGVIRAIAYNAGQYIVSGNTLNTVYTSTDLVTWTPRTTGGGGSHVALIYAMGKFVASAQSGSPFVTSIDGITWNNNGTLAPTGSGIFGLTSIPNKYVAVGGVGMIMTSPDGSTWTEVTTHPATLLNSVTFSGNQLVAVGSGGYIYTSPIPPTIVTAGTPTAFSSCAGTASTSQSFTVSGAALTTSITVTPPTDFEVCTTSGGTYTATVILPQTNGAVGTTTIYTRLKSNAIGTPSGNIVCTSGAITKNINVSGTVNSAPAITLQPSASAICAGASTTFTIAASNVTGYQWQVNQGLGYANVSNGGVYSGATTATLTISGATAGMNGYAYRAVASGACTPAATSNGVALTVNSAPAITSQPSASAICAGANTTFTIVASNATGYQWQVDQGAGYVNISNAAPYSGATTTILTITGATAGMNGYAYRTVASGGCTPAATSNGVALTINTPVAPTVTSTPATCAANGTASITNYSATLNYASTPTGATVGALGAINGTAGTAYTFKATNASTCESAASAAVTIPVQLTTNINSTVTLNSGVLTAVQTGANYQWYNCSGNIPVGSNNENFTPAQTGDYKVGITVGGCTVTSACITVATLGTTSFETTSKFTIYPNPSQGTVNIETDSNGEYQVINQLGQIVKTFRIKADVINTIDLQNLNDSVYFIKEVSVKSKSHKLIIKK